MIELVMMASAIAGVYYVIVWSVRNDKARHIGAQRGLLRMRSPADPDADPDADADATAPAGAMPVRPRGRGARSRRHGR